MFTANNYKANFDPCDDTLIEHKIMTCILDSFRMLSTLTVCVLIFKRGHFKNMSRLAKFCLMGFLAQALLYAVFDILFIAEDKLINSLEYIGWIIFYETHWLFTVHYVRAASLFRLLFSRHSENDLKVMQKRVCLVKVINLAMSVFILGISII